MASFNKPGTMTLTFGSNAMLNKLLLQLAERGPSPAMQNFCSKVLLKVARQDGESGSLLWTGRWKPLKLFVSRLEYSTTKDSTTASKYWNI